MCPGESVEKHILSCHDLRRHSEVIHVYTPKDIVNALDNEGFDATVEHPATSEAAAEEEKQIMENMGDLICFGSEEVRKPGGGIHATQLSPTQFYYHLVKLPLPLSKLPLLV